MKNTANIIICIVSLDKCCVMETVQLKAYSSTIKFKSISFNLRKSEMSLSADLF